MACKLSLVIPCLDPNDKKLKELLASIDKQDFPKEDMEVLVITEGTSESAKAIGIRRAKGDVIGFLASDNELTSLSALKELTWQASIDGASYSKHYYYDEKDNLLNRYFSLVGFNDPLAFYLHKCDRRPWVRLRKEQFEDYEFNPKGTTVGDNGFFVKKSLIENTDLDNYYHIDNANEINSEITAMSTHYIWHKTGGNIFSFFTKRYRYGLQHAFNPNRRWHLVDFRKPQDIWRLICFILFTLTLVQPLSLSLRGYRKIQDVAWFIHPVACLLTLVTYTTLMIHLGLRNLFQSSSARMVAQRA